ncbi:MAG: hypothetical protein LH649_01965 [Pseudanabaena sp. CAN_BIN31]|nr:hypothetical protein [Pseudanabaena sp. CAN_BIN31]
MSINQNSRKISVNTIVFTDLNCGLSFISLFSWLIIIYLIGFLIGLFNTVVIGDYFRALVLLANGNLVNGINDLLMFMFLCTLIFFLTLTSSYLLAFFQCLVDIITNKIYRYLYWATISFGEVIGLYTLFVIQESNQIRFNHVQDPNNGAIQLIVATSIQIVSIYIRPLAELKT